MFNKNGYNLWITILCGISFSLCAAHVHSANGGMGVNSGTNKSNSQKLIKLNFPDGVSVKVLIDYVSDRLGKNIIYSQQVGLQRVTVLSPTKIPPESLLGFLRSVLKMTGHSLVESDQDGWLKVIPNKDFLEATSDVKSGSGTLTKAKDMVVLTQIFELKYAEVAEVDKSIKAFLSKPGGNSFPIVSSDILIVTDYAANLRRIGDIIKLIDRPGGQVDIFFVKLKNNKAEEIAKSLLDVLRQKADIENKSAAGSRRRRTGGNNLTAAVVAFPWTNRLAVIVEPWARQQVIDYLKILDAPSDLQTRRYYFTYVSPERVMKLVDSVIGEQYKGRYRGAYDDDSGLLLVAGPDELQEQIAALKKELDIPESDPLRKEIQFYVIRNAVASDILDTIKTLDPDAIFSEISMEDGSTQAKSGLAAESFSGLNNPPAGAGNPLPKPPAFKSDSDGKAKKQIYDEKEQEKDRQTLVTADMNTNTIIVIGPAEVQKIYKKLISQLDKRRPQVLIEVTMVTLDSNDTAAIGVELLDAGKIGKAEYMIFSSFGLSTPDVTTGSLTLNPGTGFNGSVINAGSFSAIVRALSTEASAKVVSSPKILVNDNATATLTSINEQPYTSVNASETVSTTSFAGYASAGSTLTVTPHISEGEHLNLKYTVTLNSFTGEGSDGIPAPRQTNELTSEVTVPDGYTVVVGGLKRNDRRKSKSKVPVLGDILWLDYLFSLRENDEKESVLFVFIRPVILRDDKFEHLKYLSDIDLERAEMNRNCPLGELMIME